MPATGVDYATAKAAVDPVRGLGLLNVFKVMEANGLPASKLDELCMCTLLGEKKKRATFGTQ